ncbi:MAG: hypothetical protein GY818_05015 [Planctomycetaceae bacterium]|nr:hypothetical protein [Planctomycetaceae bacterium]
MQDLCKLMTPEEQEEAKRLYGEWFALFPDVKNPSDINSELKFNYFIGLGWEALRLMQKARKCNVSRFGYPFEWTKADYWKDGNHGQ